MVVVDSSVLIPLSRIGKLSLLREFYGTIKITEEVYEESVSSEMREACERWIRKLLSENKERIKKVSEDEGVEEADASLILLARKEGDVLLSNDYDLIMVARSKGVECAWLTTFLLRCVKKRTLTQEEAKQILYDLVSRGMRLKVEVYAAVLREMERMRG